MAIENWRQYVVGIIVTYNIFTSAIGTGWSSPSQAILQNNETSPLGYALTNEEFSTVTSVFFPAAFFGPLACGALVPIMSCRHILLIAQCIQLIGLILIAIAWNLFTLILGRILLGFVATLCSSVVFILINEIMMQETRGVISTFMSLSISTGYFFAYTLGSYSSYYVFNSVNVIIVAVHIVVTYFLPESPGYLMKKGDNEGAIKAFRKLYGEKVFDLDLKVLKPKEEEPKQKWFNRKVFTEKVDLKSIFLASTLNGCDSLTGSVIFSFYMHYIFETAGSELAPANATIIVAAFSVVASFIGSLMSRKAKRRVLLIPAYTIAMITNATLGVYFKLDNNGWDVQSTVGFLPLLTLILFTIVRNISISPLTSAAINELMTPENRTTISTLQTTIQALLSFTILRLFSVISDAMGIYTVFFICSCCCLILLLITIFILPETKGKTVEEIRMKLM